jgi:hypothetical protein
LQKIHKRYLPSSTPGCLSLWLPLLFGHAKFRLP